MDSPFSLTLENFRSFRRATTFALAPLTILTGPNSSGKSSILKALLFLRHNARIGRLSAPTFVGGGHRLGSFKNVLPYDSEAQYSALDVAFRWLQDFRLEDKLEGDTVWTGLASKYSDFHFHLKYGLAPNVYEDHFLNPPELFQGAESPENVRLWEFVIRTGPVGQERTLFTLRIGSQTTEENVEVEGQEGEPYEMPQSHIERYYEVVLHGRELIKSVDDASADDTNALIGLSEGQDAAAEAALRFINSTLKFRLHNLSVHTQPRSLSNLVAWACDTYRWIDIESDGERVDDEEMLIDNVLFREAIRDIVGKHLVSLTERLRRDLSAIDFVDAHRASARRVYPDDESSAFVDLLRTYTHPPLTEGEREEHNRGREEVARLMGEFGVGDSLRVERMADAAYAVRVVRGERLVHLADLGYGYTQLLPLILYSAFNQDTEAEEAPFSFFRIRSFPMLLVEEPEANLHPNLQAKLADLFVTMSGSEGSHTVVETHSEYLIRRLQYLVAKGEVEPERVALYYLGPDPEAEDYVRRIEIDEHGRLSQDFGPGFTDEATNLMVALYKHGRQN